MVLDSQALRRDAQAADHAPLPPERLENGWILIRDCPLGPVTISLVLVQPATGVALLEIEPQWTPNALEHFARRLEAVGFGAVHPGHLPLIYRRLRQEDVPNLPLLLSEAFIWQPPITLDPAGRWEEALCRLLTPPPVVRAEPPSPRPVMAEQPPPAPPAVLQPPLPVRAEPTPPASRAEPPSPRPVMAEQPPPAPPAVLQPPLPVRAEPTPPASRAELPPRPATAEQPPPAPLAVLQPPLPVRAEPTPPASRAESPPRPATAEQPPPAPPAVLQPPLPVLAEPTPLASRAEPPPAPSAVLRPSPPAMIGPSLASAPAAWRPRLVAAVVVLGLLGGLAASVWQQRDAEEASIPTTSSPAAMREVVEDSGTAREAVTAALPPAPVSLLTQAPAVPQPDPSPVREEVVAAAAAPAVDAAVPAEDLTRDAPPVPPDVAPPPTFATASEAGPRIGIALPPQLDATPPSAPLPIPPLHLEPLPGPLAAPGAVTAPVVAAWRPAPAEIPLPAPVTLPPAVPVAAPALPALPPVMAAPPQAPAPAAVEAAPTPPAVPAAAPRSAPPSPLVDAMLRRGEAFVALGDISGARRFFERAAQAGSAAGARALAETYDPNTLASLRVRGIEPDPRAALHWYHRAAALGATEVAANIDVIETRR